MIIKQVVDARAKVARQTLLFAKKSDAHCFHSYKLLENEKSNNQEDSNKKKIYLLTANCCSRNKGQPG